MNTIENRVIREDSFEEFFEREIDKFSKSDKRTLIVPISGFSGVGKSTFIRKIKAVCEDQNLPYIVIRNDIFLGTESGSKERKSLGDSWKNFRTKFYNEQKINEFIKKVSISTGGEISLKNTYKRFNENGEPHGKLDGEEEILVPDRNFVLILDGVNSIEYANKAAGEKCMLTGFTITENPIQPLLRAVFRDANKKGKPFEPILEERLKEYFYMQFWICKNVQESIEIIVSNPEISKEMIKKYSEKMNISVETINKKINKIIEEFKIRINKYPKKYLLFKEQI